MHQAEGRRKLHIAEGFPPRLCNSGLTRFHVEVAFWCQPTGNYKGCFSPRLVEPYAIDGRATAVGGSLQGISEITSFGMLMKTSLPLRFTIVSRGMYLSFWSNPAVITM